MSFQDSPTDSDSTPDAYDLTLALFARLIPINRPARAAVEATFTSQENLSYHRQFIGKTRYNEVDCYCFELSLAHVPDFPMLGWRFGKGRISKDPSKHYGVDLLLAAKPEDEIAGVHARLNWIEGAGGFFIIADNARGKKVILTGESFANDSRTIPYQNPILIGECLFKLEYAKRTSKEEEDFQVRLVTYFRSSRQDSQPIILPTPTGHEVRFGDWVVQNPIARGSYGIVFMVTHSQNGRLAAAKQLLRSNRYGLQFDREMHMVDRISKLKHERVASPFEITHQKIRTKVEIARIKALLDNSWDPAALMDDITDSYLIVSDLFSATFTTIITGSKLSQQNRAIFFSQLLDAIAFFHEQGIAHRDVKPDNILVSTFRPPDSKLCDFGCTSAQVEIEYDLPGTVLYLAPEQIKGRTHGRAVDYWACALVGIGLIRGAKLTRRVTIDDNLPDYQAFLEKSDSPIAGGCRAMLEAEPTLRRTAAESLFKLQQQSGLLVSTSLAVTTSGKRKHFTQNSLHAQAKKVS